MNESNIRLYIWIIAVIISAGLSVSEVPKECELGTSGYNETLCAELCTKEIQKNQTYCANFTKSMIPAATPAAAPVSVLASASAVSVSASASAASDVQSNMTVVSEVATFDNTMGNFTEMTSNHTSAGFNLKSSVTLAGSCLILSCILL